MAVGDLDVVSAFGEVPSDGFAGGDAFAGAVDFDGVVGIVGDGGGDVGEFVEGEGVGGEFFFAEGEDGVAAGEDVVEGLLAAGAEGEGTGGGGIGGGVFAGADFGDEGVGGEDHVLILGCGGGGGARFFGGFGFVKFEGFEGVVVHVDVFGEGDEAGGAVVGEAAVPGKEGVAVVVVGGLGGFVGAVVLEEELAGAGDVEVFGGFVVGEGFGFGEVDAGDDLAVGVDLGAEGGDVTGGGDGGEVEFAEGGGSCRWRRRRDLW